jgi:hypothetical protein
MIEGERKAAFLTITESSYGEVMHKFLEKLVSLSNIILTSDFLGCNVEEETFTQKLAN